MPEEVLSSVKPLQIWPNRGLVVITGYVYEYCDNDIYKEVSLAIVTNKPDGTKLSLASLAGQSLSDDYWGYVLKLPVNTELARVRGVVGYNLPKWLTDINYSESNDAVTFEVIDQETGKVDIAFSGAKLGDLSQKPQLVTNNFTNIGQDGKLTHGYAVSKQLSQGASSDKDSFSLTLGEGSFSEFIKSLNLGKLIKYEYVPEFQSALYAPEYMEDYLADYQ